LHKWTCWNMIRNVSSNFSHKVFIIRWQKHEAFKPLTHSDYRKNVVKYWCLFLTHWKCISVTNLIHQPVVIIYLIILKLGIKTLVIKVLNVVLSKSTS
jgi:hypothetical protein